MARVEPDVVDALVTHDVEDRPGHDVPRREVGELVAPLHDPCARAVDEEGALAADGLGDERLLPRRALTEEEHRGVELHELEVGDPRAGAQRGRHAAAGGHRGVGGGRVDLAQTAGRQHDGPAVGRADPVHLPLADDVQRHPAHRAGVGGQQVDDQGVLDHLDAGVVDDPVEGRDERP